VVYSPSVTVSLAYRQDQIGRSLDGTGFIAPQQAGGCVRACTYASQKFPERAPSGFVLLRAFLSPCDGNPALTARKDLESILRISGEPLWSRTFQWIKGLPRYPRDHATHLTAVRQRLARLNPLALAGAGYDGAGVSACVKSGRQAARTIMARLRG
jgi:oxygen-dependent protoporphyrinogen oxidase